MGLKKKRLFWSPKGLVALTGGRFDWAPKYGVFTFKKISPEGHCFPKSCVGKGVGRRITGRKRRSWDLIFGGVVRKGGVCAIQMGSALEVVKQGGGGPPVATQKAKGAGRKPLFMPLKKEELEERGGSAE